MQVYGVVLRLVSRRRSSLLGTRGPLVCIVPLPAKFSTIILSPIIPATTPRNGHFSAVAYDTRGFGHGFLGFSPSVAR